ncbi:MAG: endonuclease V, partial [Armatimonadota bacterium]
MQRISSKMSRADLHSWDLSADAARSVQERLRSRVIVEPLPDDVRLVAGTACICRAQPHVVATAVVVSVPEFEVVCVGRAAGDVAFPYEPGLLAFREGPLLLQAFRRLSRAPDVLLCHAHGVAHPRRFGIASHLGLLLDLPTVGCAKRLVVGRHGALATQRGARADIVEGNEVEGSALRTRDEVGPVYVS